MIAYLVAALISIGGAFYISTAWLASGRAQTSEVEGAPNGVTNGSGGSSKSTTASPAAPSESATSASARPVSNDNGSEESGGLEVTAAQDGGAAQLEGFLEPFIYDSSNRRDPFLPYSEYAPVDETPSLSLSPAQRYPLEELKLVGVMWDVKSPKAMFMDPQQEVITIGRDESIGNRNGYVAAIREGEVVVVESMRKRGDIIYRTRVLRIER